MELQSCSWEKSKNTWLEGEPHFETQQIVEVTKLYYLSAPQETIQEQSLKKKKGSTAVRKGYNTCETWYL